jgi:type I site-specific restriction endonuclease
MGIFDPDEVITIYSLKQAIEDGMLVEIFKNRLGELSCCDSSFV